MNREAHFELPPLPEPGEWPEWVPVLTGEDMVRGPLHDGCHHCAIGWSAVLGIPRYFIWAAYRELYDASSVAFYNDCECQTDDEAAEAFNKAMRHLGYTEDGGRTKP